MMKGNFMKNIGNKRLNPITKEPFKHGDIREDGYIFKQYLTTIKKDGFYIEAWFSPEAFKKMRYNANERSKKNQRNMRLTPKGRAHKLLLAAQRRAKDFGGKVTIDDDWISKKIENGFCELSGLPFDLSPVKNNKKNRSPKRTVFLLCGLFNGEY